MLFSTGGWKVNIALDYCNKQVRVRKLKCHLNKDILRHSSPSLWVHYWIQIAYLKKKKTSEHKWDPSNPFPGRVFVHWLFMHNRRFRLTDCQALRTRFSIALCEPPDLPQLTHRVVQFVGGCYRFGSARLQHWRSVAGRGSDRLPACCPSRPACKIVSYYLCSSCVFTFGNSALPDTATLSLLYPDQQNLFFILSLSRASECVTSQHWTIDTTITRFAFCLLLSCGREGFMNKAVTLLSDVLSLTHSLESRASQLFTLLVLSICARQFIRFQKNKNKNRSQTRCLGRLPGRADTPLVDKQRGRAPRTRNLHVIIF